MEMFTNSIVTCLVIIVTWIIAGLLIRPILRGVLKEVSAYKEREDKRAMQQFAEVFSGALAGIMTMIKMNRDGDVISTSPYNGKVPDLKVLKGGQGNEE